MRSVLLRLAGVVAAIVVVVSCDAVPRTTGVPKATGATNTGGGTSTGTTNSAGTKPQAQIDSPATSSINLGDTLLVAVTLHDLVSMTNTTISGLTYHGSADLGTLQELVKYGPLTAPASGGFPKGTKDTVIRRILVPNLPLDSAADSLVIQVVTTDSLGGVDTTRRTYAMYAGPSLVVYTPKASDTLPAGIPFRFVAEAKHPLGLSSMTFHVKGDTSFKTKLDTTVVKSYSGNPTDKLDSIIVMIPADAPAGSKLTLSVTALDIRAQTKVITFVVPVRAAGTTPIRVTQAIGNRLEIGDTISVHATGDGIVWVGYLARDSVGNKVYRDSIAQPGTSNGDAVFKLDSIPVTAQGHNLAFTGFARDKSGNLGYASTASGTDSLLANASVDSALIVYGHTYAVPSGRGGVMGDVAVDQPRGKVYLSNMNSNRLELWTGSSTGGTFDPFGVSVGSLPWGMTVDLSGDTLLVANSGGTNISKVTLAGTPAEIVGARLLTRATVVYTMHQQYNPTTALISMSIDYPPTQYSDRPQYIAVAKGGRLYYSTRPTTSAKPGTIRYLDPAQAVPDPHQIYQYGKPANDTTEYAIFNADSILYKAGTDGIKRLAICDHKAGTNDYPGYCTNALTIEAAVSDVNAYGGDVVAVRNLDVASLALEDTTFVSSSSDHKWIAFGEGNTSGTGRVMMVKDSTNPGPQFLSPSISVADLVNNASEHVFGLALDSTGATLGVHGASSYFSAVENPFHLRLQGVYGSFGSGAGVAFHPRANGPTTVDDRNRLAFVASANSTVEVVDIAHYVNRGVLPTKRNFYGALRASLPFATDPPSVVLKLFGLTTQGLVVIDIRQNDIKPAP